MSLLSDAKKVVRGDFIIGQKEDNVQLSEKCKFRMNKLIEKLKGRDIANFTLPYVKAEMDKFLENPDPEFEIPSNVVIELLEKLVYSNNKEATMDDKIIIGYLSIYCSI